jgi:hypothetical protein
LQILISVFRPEEIKAWVDLSEDGICPELYLFRLEGNKVVVHMEKLDQGNAPYEEDMHELPYISFFSRHVFFRESEPKTVCEIYANQIFAISNSSQKYLSPLFKPMQKLENKLT